MRKKELVELLNQFEDDDWIVIPNGIGSPFTIDNVCKDEDGDIILNLIYFQ